MAKSRTLFWLLLLISLSCICSSQTRKPVAESNPFEARVAQGNAAATKGDWLQAETIFKKLIAENDGFWEWYESLGEAQLRLAKYSDATKTLERGIYVAGTTTEGPMDHGKKFEDMAKMLTLQANAYLKLNKNQEANRAFERAASLSSISKTAYFNLCVDFSDTGDAERAVPTCWKAIEADPAKAETYFVLGSMLFNKGKLNGDKYVVPEGTSEALKKYLELAPNGPHAKDVKDMVDKIAPNN